MWTHTSTEMTDVPIAHLWSVLADIQRWPEVDTQIEAIDVRGEPQVGKRFKLEPIGGPTLSLVVDRFDPPNTNADICFMPFAKMRTTHQLTPKGDMTEIRVEIEIFGLLAPVWSRLVGQKHANGLAAQTKRFVARARELNLLKP